VVSITHRPHFTPGKDPVPILQVAGWAPGPVWTGGKSRAHRDLIPDRPARSQSLYRLSYPAHNFKVPRSNENMDTFTFTHVPFPPHPLSSDTHNISVEQYKLCSPVTYPLSCTAQCFFTHTISSWFYAFRCLFTPSSWSFNLTTAPSQHIKCLCALVGCLSKIVVRSQRRYFLYH